MPTFIAEHWHVWLVTGALIWAAVIDGIELRVPNWITFPFIISGWVYSTVAFGWEVEEHANHDARKSSSGGSTSP